jgi:tartrate dehydratase beta subunit/fumarate hydratase class I family protein
MDQQGNDSRIRGAGIYRNLDYRELGKRAICTCEVVELDIIIVSVAGVLLC